MTRRRYWQHAEDALLREAYPDTATATIAEALGRGVGSVYQRANLLGLSKSAEYLAGPHACRLRRGDGVGAASRFKPGLVPWNKGIAFDSGGRSVETRFKPGRPASEARNYQPIGTLRLSKDGYLERKVTDDPRLAPARRWVAVHRLVWENKHGPVPSGSVVVFQPGKKTTDLARITVDALDLVTRAELMRRNSVHAKYPPELARLVQLRGALQRQINSRAKQEQAHG